MKRFLASLQLLSIRIDRIALLIASAGLALMVVCMLIQIVGRYIFAEPPAWTEELARYAMIWAGFIGATTAFKRGLDPVLVRFENFQRPWMRTAAYGIEFLCVSAFCGAILIATPQFIDLHLQRLTDTMELPSAIVFAVIPASMAMILFHAIVCAMCRLCGIQPLPADIEEIKP